MVTKKINRETFTKWLEKHRGWGTDMLADMGGDADLATAAQEVATEMVRFPDQNDGAVDAVAYLRSTGVQDLVGCLADYLYDVRSK